MQESRSSVPAFNGRTLIRCSKCNVVYLDEQPTAAELEGINSRYWDVADDCGAFVSLVHEAQMASRVDYLTSRLGSLGGLAVLDVGAGPGLLQRALRRTGQAVNYHAIEPDADCWPRLMREGAVKIWTGLRECDKRSFDLVVLSHVLEHVGDPLDFLEGVSGLSSTGGSIFIEVPNQDYLHKNNLGTHLLFFSHPVCGGSSSSRQYPPGTWTPSVRCSRLSPPPGKPLHVPRSGPPGCPPSCTVPATGSSTGSGLRARTSKP